MSDMIEQVARAIDPGAFDEEGNRERGINLDRMRLRRTKARKAAHAAIEAMREPTDWMCESGLTEALNSSFLLSDEATRFGDGQVNLGPDFLIVTDPEAIFRAMIDAAIATSGENKAGTPQNKLDQGVRTGQGKF